MNITFLIGNGFDVGLGIKTSYSKFYEWYCPKVSKHEHINEFRRNIKDDVSRDVPAEEKTWADFELGLGQYTANFDAETVELFLDCLEDAQENIRTYLKEQEATFSIDNYTEESLVAFQRSLWKFFEDISDLEKDALKSTLSSVPNEHRVISFVTFNYTGILEQIIETIPNESLATWKHGSNAFAYKLNRNVIHVHGTTNVFPVLGVNDESQVAQKELLKTPQFAEYFFKAENVRALGQLWHTQAEAQISNSRVVCILGMSLGATDAKWWRKLAQWLKSSNARHLIIYWHEKVLA